MPWWAHPPKNSRASLRPRSRSAPSTPYTTWPILVTHFSLPGVVSLVVLGEFMLKFPNIDEVYTNTYTAYKMVAWKTSQKTFVVGSIESFSQIDHRNINNKIRFGGRLAAASAWAQKGMNREKNSFNSIDYNLKIKLKDSIKSTCNWWTNINLHNM